MCNKKALAPRARVIKPKALIFEAADSKAVGTIAGVGVGYCAVEAQETSISATYRATYRATPIDADSALMAEQTIDVITETSRRKLKGRVIGVGIVVPSTKGICSVPFGIGRHMVVCWARPLVGCSPTVVVVVASPIIKRYIIISQNKVRMSRFI